MCCQKEAIIAGEEDTSYPPLSPSVHLTSHFYGSSGRRLLSLHVHLTSYLYGSVGPHRQGCSDVANRVDTHVVWLSQGLLRVLRLGGGSESSCSATPKKLFEWKKKSFFLIWNPIGKNGGVHP